jgi:hypothetical protein
MSSENVEQGFGSPGGLRRVWDRRQQAKTDQSVTSMTSSLAAAVQPNLVLEDKLAREAAEETAQQTLKRHLSVKSAISTSSSFAERQQAAAGSSLPFREIGTGSVGKVFEKPGTPWAFKGFKN